ncbi:MAG: peptide chain release factor 1 [Firmicutes bacterium]|nr:peptide chain release factor 1 [Bacillota bacterium]
MNTKKLESLKAKYDELSIRVADGAIIGTSEWTKLVKEQAGLEGVVSGFLEYQKIESDLRGAKEMLASETDAELLEMAKEELKEKSELLDKKEQELKILLLPKDPDDDKNVIVEIRAGAGGDEAALFGYTLMRMYKMYAERCRWKIEDIDVSMTEIGGIKEASFMISGADTYAKLKFESGVHRVQRVPATETQGRVHTSTVTVAVLPEAENVEIEILDKDLKIDTYRSGGAGGQHVNKTESAIRITHIPTGIVVQCQDEKSQIKNREKAMKTLKTKLYDHFKSIADSKYASTRKSQVGTGDRSERIRTYNYSQGRITDHRIGLTMYNLTDFVNGDIAEMLEALRIADQTARLNEEVD